MVPSAVVNAWQSLPESHKTAICRLCAAKLTPLFSRWVEAAGLKKFRAGSLANRKAGSAPRLDAVLFQAEEGRLAKDLLVAYFTELAPSINDQCLDMLDRAENEEPATKLKVYAQILHAHRDSPFIRLYLATALWVEGFKEEDGPAVEALAAGLSRREDTA